MQYPQCLPLGCIPPKMANDMMSSISKSYIFQHMVILQELFKKTMTPETSTVYVNHLEVYIQKYRNGEFVQQNSSMPKSEIRNSNGNIQSHEVVM